MTEEYTTTTIDLLRHGECEGGRIFRGTTDVNLLPQGMEKMHKVCNAADAQWDRIISSPLQRCKKFSEALSGQKNVSLILDNNLREMSFGEWEGREISRVWQEDEVLMSAWGDDPERHTPPKAEPLHEVLERVKLFHASLLEQHHSKHILVVTHGGIIRVMLAYLLNMPMSRVNHFDVPYACFSRFSIFHTERGDISKLIAHNFSPFSNGIA